jgi:hypothetical protein
MNSLLRKLLLIAFTLLPGAAAEPCETIVTFADNKKPLREIFVSPVGDNSTGDGSRQSPFQTVNRALQGVKPGDAVRLLPGEYRVAAYLANLAGTKEAPIWFGGLPGEARPVFIGGAGLHLSRVRYLIVENLEITGATGNGLNCDDGGQFKNPEATQHVVFRNLHMRDIGSGGNQDGLKLSGVNDFFVLDCEFTRVSKNGSGIDHVGCHRGLVARCVFTEGGNSVQCKGGSEDIEIRANRFLDVAGRGINIGGSTGLTLFRPPLATNAPNVEARNIRVFANLFRGCEGPICFVGAVNSIAANNTIVDPQRFIVRILQESVSKDGITFVPCATNQFVNNLIYFHTATVRMPVNIGSNTDAASFTFANNLWFAKDRPDRSRPALPSPETNGIYGTDPLFKDVSSGDYELSPQSPAAGKGLKLPNPRADLKNRCFEEPRSIGAFELER